MARVHHHEVGGRHVAAGALRTPALHWMEVVLFGVVCISAVALQAGAVARGAQLLAVRVVAVAALDVPVGHSAELVVAPEHVRGRDGGVVPVERRGVAGRAGIRRVVGRDRGIRVLGLDVGARASAVVTGEAQRALRRHLREEVHRLRGVRPMAAGARVGLAAGGAAMRKPWVAWGGVALALVLVVAATILDLAYDGETGQLRRPRLDPGHAPESVLAEYYGWVSFPLPEGAKPDAKIVPFRGEYYKLKPAAQQYATLAAGAPGGPYLPPSTNPFDRVTDIDAGLGVNTNEGGVSGITEWNFGLATLTSVSAWRFWNWDAANDRDYTGLPIQLTQHIPSRQDQFSQELRIASNQPGRIEYVAGLYYFHQKIVGHPISIYGPLATYWLLPASATRTAALLDGYQTDGTTGKLPVGEEDLEHLAHGNSRHGEIVSLEAKTRPADGHGNNRL